MQIDRANEALLKRIIGKGNMHAKKFGTLLSVGLNVFTDDVNEAVQEMHFCKKYCIIDYNNDEQSFPKFAYDDLPDYDHVICLAPIRDRTTKSAIDTHLTEIVNGLRNISKPVGDHDESENILFVLFDPQGLLFESKIDPKPIFVKSQANESRCIAVVPLSQLKSRLSGWDSGNGKAEKFPLHDWNGCVDSYIFVDQGDVLIGNERYDNKFCKFIQDNFVYLHSKTRKNHWTVIEGSAKSRIWITGDIKDQQEMYLEIDPYTKDCLGFVKGILRLLTSSSNETDSDFQPRLIKKSIKHVKFSDDSEQIEQGLKLRVALSLALKVTEFGDESNLRELFDSVAYVLELVKHKIIEDRESYEDKYEEILSKFAKTDEGKIDFIHHSQITSVLSTDIKLDNLASTCISDTIEHCPVTDLYFTSVIAGNSIAVEEILQYTESDEIIANALYAVGVFNQQLKHPLVGITRFSTEEARKRLKMSSESLESTAKAIIHFVYARNKFLSTEILFKPFYKFNDYTPFDLACMAKARSFLSDDACTYAISQCWSGPLSHVSWRCIFLLIILPCLHPLFLKETEPSNPINPPMNAKQAENTNISKISISIYEIPIVKCIVSFAVYFSFLFLYSYVVLKGIDMDPSVLEFVVLSWMLTLFVDEIRQILGGLGLGRELSISKRLSQHFHRFWNILDLTILLLYTLGFSIRIAASLTKSYSLLTLGQCILAANTILLYIRSLHFFTMIPNIGPLLITMGYMTKDLARFFFILFIVMVGYGIALHAVLFPNSASVFGVPDGLLFMPYFQIYGELFLDEIIETSANETLQDPQFRNYFAISLVGIYLLFTNILLLNLLIALFNSSYSRVEADSNFHSIINKVEFLREYQNAPILPPPFVLVSYFIMFIKSLSGKCRKNQVEPDKSIKSEELVKHDNQNSESAIPEEQNSVESNGDKPFANYVSEYFNQHQQNTNEKLELDIQVFKKKTNAQLKQIMQQMDVQTKKTKKQFAEMNEKLDTIIQQFSKLSPQHD